MDSTMLDAVPTDDDSEERLEACESAPAAPSPSNARRRGMDKTWEVDEERKFEATQAAQAIQVASSTSTAELTVSTEPVGDAVDGFTAAAVVAETVKAPGNIETAPQTSPSSPPPSPSGAGSTLRRLKQLDAMTAGAIEQECGVALRSSDSFRLTLQNQHSALKRQTRVLIVMAGSTFLCEEPISEEGQPMSGPPSPVAGQGVAREVLGELAQDGTRPEAEDSYEKAGSVEGSIEYEDDFEEFDELEDAEGACVVAELCFFRGKPSRGGLARKLGAVPVLHVTLSTSDGLRENLEFVGVHQRRYFVEEPGTDAIAKNLTMSLLKVALEFVFHPSRTRYTKEHLILRECSAVAEVRDVREELMPQMAEEVRKFNSKIEKVSLEFLPPRVRLSGSAALKGRSFLILDEDVLKVAPAKESVTQSRPIKGTFQGLGEGFLNSSKAKRKGLSSEISKPQQTPLVARSSEASSSSATPEAEADGASASGDRAAASETLSPKAQATESAIQTNIDEKRRLLMGAADVDWKVSTDMEDFAKRVIPGCGQPGVSTIREDEEEVLEDQEPAGSIADLANSLFGIGEMDDPLLDEIEASADEPLTDRTGSTTTPSPKGTSVGGGAPSERSEPATEDSVDQSGSPTSAAAGIRGLQQRRNEHRQQAAAEAATEQEELLNLWMKQRW